MFYYFYFDRVASIAYISPAAMKLKYLAVNLLWTVVAIGNTSEDIKDCEIRFEDNGACACSSAGPVTRYSDRSILIKPGYCMYYDPAQNLSVVGHCYYSSYELSGTIKWITSSVQFNANICHKYGHLNRTGRFCGQCNESYGLAAYSYQLFSCIPCQDYGYENWLRYFAVALLPVTVFYILAVMLSFNVTSSGVNGIVLVIQCIMSPVQITIVQGSPILIHYSTTMSLLKAATSLFCIVNLDFFRLVYPPFCLHPEASVFQILSLDYIVALYPFLLIFMTYVLVTAYDKRYRLVVWMWRPVQWCVHRHRNTWNIRTSLIEIFATFILFSYVKILGVSVQILAFTATYDVAGNRLQHYYTYFDGTMEYFGPAHLPYALLSITISSVFVVLPFFLLAVHPCRCFHKCLNYCGLRSQALHIFMDAFQGSYRIEPCDLRYFSAFYLFLRIFMLLQFQMFPSSLLFFTSGILSLTSAAILAAFQPYRVKAHNTIDSILIMLMGIYFVSYHAQLTVGYEDTNIPLAFQGVSIALMLLYFASLLVWKLVGGQLLQALVNKAKVVWSSSVHRQSKRDGMESFDRELDTSEADSYPPLLEGSRTKGGSRTK